MDPYDWFCGPGSHIDRQRDSLVVAPAELGQVRQFLNADDGVVDGRLKTLSDGVGQNHSDHDGQNVTDLTRQLKHDHGRGNRVCDRSG